MTVALVANIARPISSAISTAFAMDNYGKLNDYGKLGAWSPLSLFASGEQGAWYDPSDLTTMFQDRAGTTPVTADGQTVGLILDKSKGLALGNESLDGNWVIGTGGTILTIVTNGFTMESPAGGYGCVKDTITIPGDKTYICEFDYMQGASVTVGLRVLLGQGTASVVQVDIPNSSGHKKVILKSASGGNTNFAVQFIDGTAGRIGTFTNLTVKEIAGNHAVAPSDAARPLKTSTGLSKLIDYDAVDDVLNTTFTTSLGSSCTVCRANVGAAPTILTAQTIGTSYADSTDHAGLIIINRAITGQETTDVTAWLLAKGATA